MCPPAAGHGPDARSRVKGCWLGQGQGRGRARAGHGRGRPGTGRCLLGQPAAAADCTYRGWCRLAPFPERCQASVPSIALTARGSSFFVRRGATVGFQGLLPECEFLGERMSRITCAEVVALQGLCACSGCACARGDGTMWRVLLGVGPLVGAHRAVFSSAFTTSSTCPVCGLVEVPPWLPACTTVQTTHVFPRERSPHSPPLRSYAVVADSLHMSFSLLGDHACISHAEVPLPTVFRYRIHGMETWNVPTANQDVFAAVLHPWRQFPES